MTRAIAWALLGGLALVSGGCGPQRALPPAPPPPEVTTAPAIKRTVVDFDEYTGRLQAVDAVDVHARVNGYLDEVKFQDGDLVEAGEPLFQIDPRTYQALYDQAQARIEVWQAKYDFAESTRARNESLRGTGAVSKEAYEGSVASRNEAASEILAAKADAAARKLDLEFCTIRSPVAGRVDRALVTPGNLVQSGPGLPTLLTKIVSVDPIYAYFDVDELALLRYNARRQAEEGTVNSTPLRQKNIPVEVTLADGTAYAEPGVIDFCATAVDPGTGTAEARAVLPNPQGGLAAGLFVRVRVSAAPPYQAVLVADQAILANQNQKFVYVVNADGAAVPRNVVTGSKHGAARVVREGVAEGDQVIVNGLLLVRPGKPVQAKPGQMPEPPPVDPKFLRAEFRDAASR